MAQAGVVQAGMDGGGTNYWRRALSWTFAGIFAVALAGGLVGSVTGGGAVALPAGHPPHHTAAASPPRSVAPTTTARGAQALLQLSDLPSGWVAGQTPAATTRVSPWSSGLASCVGIPARIATVAPTKVNSPDFTSADQALAVEDSVSVLPSKAVARAEYAAMASSRTAGCMNRVAAPALQSSMQHQAGSGATVGVISFSGLPAAAGAHHMAGFTVTIPIARGGRVLKVTSTQVDFVTGPLLHQVTFNGNGTSFPAPLEEQVLNAIQAAR
jgi:hypothetical protein